MVDCKNYRYQNNPKEEWCLQGCDTSWCEYGSCCPFYEKCEDEQDLRDRHYPDEN